MPHGTSETFTDYLSASDEETTSVSDGAPRGVLIHAVLPTCVTVALGVSLNATPSPTLQRRDSLMRQLSARARRLVAPTPLFIAVLGFVGALRCQAQSGDAAAAKALANVARIAAACPSGQRTEKQQAECSRVVDSIQASRARQLKTLELDAAIDISRDVLLDSSFVADDDGGQLSPGRWVRIGSVRGEGSLNRTGLEVNVGRVTGDLILVGALLTDAKTAVSLALQIDCRRKQALVVKLLAGDAIDVEVDKGIGPWYPIGKRQTVIQHIARRACG